MKIQYDHQIFASQKNGGISRYFYELTKEIVSILNIKNKIKIIPVSASKFSSKESAMRPALALIENKKLTQENLDLQRKWQDSLREY